MHRFCQNGKGYHHQTPGGGPLNPFELKPMKVEDGISDWAGIYPKPYDKNAVDPYTRIRIILMNGIEVEQVFFKHQFHRNCPDNDLRRELALSRRVEQQQQKRINWLKPIDETQLETTIGYEHVAVDLTAWLAQNEPDAYVKKALDFALLEDFDHLYRYANLLDLDAQIPSQQIVKSYVDITPGRPTIAEHRHPFDSVKNALDFYQGGAAHQAERADHHLRRAADHEFLHERRQHLWKRPGASIVPGDRDDRGTARDPLRRAAGPESHLA